MKEGGCAMDVREFEEILGLADRQLEAAKRQREERARVESAGRRLKLVRGRVAALESKVAELAGYGEAPLPRVAEALAALRDEEGRIMAEFPEADGQAGIAEFDPRIVGNNVAAGALAKEAPRPVPDSEKPDILKLFDDMEAADLDSMDGTLRLLTLRIWSLRWRLAVDRIGNGRAAADPAVRAAYAKIIERVTRWSAPFIPCLAREREGDWAAELEAATESVEDRLAALERCLETIRDIAAVSLLLTAQTPEGHDADKDALDKLRHMVRSAATVASMRPMVAEAAAKIRARLGDEFRFLWDRSAPAPAEAEPGREPMSRHRIAARLLRRMLSKDAIGACHVPLDMLHRGFPGDAQGEAKDVVEMLVRHGVVRRKDTGIGPRVSIEPSCVQPARAFVEAGGRLGVSALDGWIEKDGA